MASEVAPTPTPTTPSKHDRDVTIEAVNHLIQGKRHLLVQDIPSAVTSLEEACRLLDACYGQLSNECGDAYYYYGIALLEMSRRETGILGNGKDGSGSEDEEEDDDDDDDDEEDGDAESGDDGSKTTEKIEQDCAVASTARDGETSENADSKGTGVDGNRVPVGAGGPEVGDSEAKSEDLEDSEKADEGKNDEKKEEPSTSDTATAVDGTKGEVSSCPSKAVSASPSDAKPGTSDGNEAKDESKDDDDPSSLQLAWEVLEVAKLIYKRQAVNNSEMQLKFALVHAKLGEVAMESENYQQSIDDLTESLNIRTSLLPADDRIIAETYYQLGLAYSFDSQFDLSMGSFKNAINVLEMRMANLEKLLEKEVERREGEGDYSDPHADTKKEIEEVKELIPEIREKIVDTDDLQKNTVKLSKVLNNNVVPESCKNASEELVDSTTSPSQLSAKPTMNISHLVRKKRKPDDSEVSTSNSDEMGTKRSRSEEGVTNDGVSDSGDIVVSNGESSAIGVKPTETGCGETSKAVDNTIDSTAMSV